MTDAERNSIRQGILAEEERKRQAQRAADRVAEVRYEMWRERHPFAYRVRLASLPLCWCACVAGIGAMAFVQLVLAASLFGVATVFLTVWSIAIAVIEDDVSS